LYPTRVALARAGNTTCRRCKSSLEILGYISGQCPAMKGYRINRHNGICGILSRQDGVIFSTFIAEKYE